MLGTALGSMDDMPDSTLSTDARSDSEGGILAKHSGPIVANGPPPSAGKVAEEEMQVRVCP